MQSRRKTLLYALAVGVVGGIITMEIGGIPDACRMFREEIKQSTLNENGLAGLVASVPERIIDQAEDERYKGMTAEQCTTLTPEVTNAVSAMGKTAWSAKMPQAAEESTAAIMQCRDKRVNGEIKTHAESAQCSNSQITNAYSKIGYPYMDLVKQFTDKRLEEAQRLDKSMFNAAEDPIVFATLALSIAQEERKRIAGNNTH